MHLQCLLFTSATFVLFNLSGAQRCSNTNGDGPRKKVPCIFPFVYRGVSHNECTDVSDPDGKFWCSTKVDRNRKHVGGSDEWGYCDPNCQQLSDSENSRATTTTTTTTTTKITTTTRTTTTATRQTSTTTELQLRSQLVGKPSEDGNYLPDPDKAECGYRLATGFILGGEDTKRGDYPFIAALGYDKPSGRIYGCSGTLINRRYVLTAAHCHSRFQPIVEVILGEHNFELDPDCPDCTVAQRFAISPKDVTVHERFSLTNVARNGDDIALIRLPRLAETVDENPEQPVMPVCLPWKSSKLPSHETIAMGWGRRNNDPNDRGNLTNTGAFSNILQQLIVPQVPTQQCKKFPSFQDINEQKQICAGGEPGKDSCKGDSGGPLVVRESKDAPMYLYGVVSFGTKQCGAGVPGVYTNVNYYMEWITSHLKL